MANFVAVDAAAVRTNTLVPVRPQVLDAGDQHVYSAVAGHTEVLLDDEIGLFADLTVELKLVVESEVCADYHKAVDDLESRPDCAETSAEHLVAEGERGHYVHGCTEQNWDLIG